MKREDITVKTVLAIFIVFFGMTSLVFIKLPDIVLGALIGLISGVRDYHFGSSAGSSAKDKLLQENQNKK